MKENAITLTNITKRYSPDRLAVRGISLEVRQGECYGVLGPNGAGKSTLMKMMYCSTDVTSGELYVLGLNVKRSRRDIKSRVGVVPQADGLDTDFTAYENLLIYANYFGISRSEAAKKAQLLLKKMRLEDYSARSIEELSGGIKRRLTIARALMTDPEILFLDEPTTGLDLQSRLWIWDFLKSYKKEGHTVLLTTHYIEEAEAICDRIAIVDEGKIVTVGQPSDLIFEHYGKRVLEFEVHPADINYYLNRLKEMNLIYHVIGNSVIVAVGPEQDGRVLASLISSEKIQIRRPTLSDVFLKLTGHQIKDENYEV